MYQPQKEPDIVWIKNFNRNNFSFLAHYVSPKDWKPESNSSCLIIEIDTLEKS